MLVWPARPTTYTLRTVADKPPFFLVSQFKQMVVEKTGLSTDLFALWNADTRILLTDTQEVCQLRVRTIVKRTGATQQKQHDHFDALVADPTGP